MYECVRVCTSVYERGVDAAFGLSKAFGDPVDWHGMYMRTHCTADASAPGVLVVCWLMQGHAHENINADFHVRS